MTRRRTAGFTLIEMMTVVVIMGVMATMSIAAIQSVARNGRVNGNATAISRILMNARVRSIAERCRYIVQMSGPAWGPAAPAPGQRVAPNAVTTFRKANCDSANGFWEPGDHFISDYFLDTSTSGANGTGVRFQFNQVGLMPGDVLGANAITFSWTTTGERQLYLDTTNTANWALTALANDFEYFIVPSDAPSPAPATYTPGRVVKVPAAGNASAK